MLSTTDLQHELYSYKLVMHINGLSSILSALLAVYLIIYKSTAQMKSYSFYLLNIVFWASALDVYLGLLYTPQLLFPSTGLCTQGLFSLFENFKFRHFQFVSILNNKLRNNLIVRSFCAF